MTDRREFLQYAVVSAVPLATGVALESRASARDAVATPPAVRHVVVDSRHAESRAFGARLAVSGATLHSLADGDPTDLWLRTLAPAWARAPVAVAGLTRAPALFVLEQCAWSHGLRVVYHAEHVLAASERPRHELQRLASGAPAPSASSMQDAAWPEHVAALVRGFAPVATASRPGPTASGLLPALPAGAELLTSWIIAPV